MRKLVSRGFQYGGEAFIIRSFMNNSPLIVFFGLILIGIFVLEHYVLIPHLVTPVTTSLKNHSANRLRVVQEVDPPAPLKQFTVVIVTFNEVLLNKTNGMICSLIHSVNNVLENTPSHLLKEVLIIDDQSDVPVAGWENDTRVRIIRTDHNLGLINARILGGNEARGDFLAFIDAHVFVSPRWLNTPYRFLSENPKTIVNFVNFKLNGDTYRPMSIHAGIGSSASFTWSLGIFWGGGSSKDDCSPITMGMFSISKYWWNMGQMDTGMGRWGGENIEISLRTWLCGGQIRVANDSFVAHKFNSRFPYKVNPADIQRNNLRVASVWLDGEYLQRYYQSAKIKLVDGKPKMDIGDISERLALKKKLNCKPFSWYVDFFKGRAPCSKGEKCGGGSTVKITDYPHFTVEDAFYKK